MKRHAPDFYHGGGDFSPRVGDFTHRGDELHHSSVHLTARTGEKQFGRPQLRPQVGDFKRFVVDILPLIKRIPRLAPHMRRSAPWFLPRALDLQLMRSNFPPRGLTLPLPAPRLRRRGCDFDSVKRRLGTLSASLSYVCVPLPALRCGALTAVVRLPPADGRLSSRGTELQPRTADLIPVQHGVTRCQRHFTHGQLSSTRGQFQSTCRGRGHIHDDFHGTRRLAKPTPSGDQDTPWRDEDTHCRNGDTT